MTIRRTLALALLAACSSPKASAPQRVPVPITAASVQIQTPQIARDDQAPPYALTASDGSGLQLVRIDAKAVFEGPLAYTELHLWFHNSEARRREGTFAITLPAHASVSRFAMENDGQWQEAEVVEKQLARRAYDDFLHRRQDPALLEKAPGNQFTAKVFPIAPNADKHIVISYSQQLPGQAYLLPLRGLPKTGRVDVELAVTSPDGKRVTQHLAQKDWVPDRDFVSTVTTGAAAISAGTVIAAQVTVGAAETSAQTPQGVTLLVDTSASRALGYEAYVANVAAMIEKLRGRYGDNFPVQVVAFDQDAETIFRGPAKQFGVAEQQKLIARGAAGASDLGQALAFVGAQGAQPRLVLVGDGVITAGAEGAELAAKLKAVPKVERIDVVLAGGLRDDAAATALVRAGLPHAGLVLDEHEDLAAALAQPVAIDVPVTVEGATWSYPRTIPTARPGDRVMVYAQLGKPAQTVDVSVGGAKQAVAMLAGTGPLVERAVAGAQIEELEAQLAGAKPEMAQMLRAQIAKKSVASRVVSTQTSMLVLESDADYARYGIDRTALADVLVIDNGTIDRLHRKQTAPVQIAQNEMPKVPADEGGTGTAMALDEGKMGKKDADRADSPAMRLADDDGDGKDQAEAPPPPQVAQAEADLRAAQGQLEVARSREQQLARQQAVEEARTAGVLGSSADPGAGAGQGYGVGGGRGGMHGRAPTAQAVDAPAPEPAPPPPSTGRFASVTSNADISSGFDSNGLGAQAWPPPGSPAPLTGDLATIEHSLASHDTESALRLARTWHTREPGNVLALIGLGDALEQTGATSQASRIYGSIIDLFPGRADMRRFAGERLARLQTAAHDQDLIIDTYRRAVADRPDHMTGHRLLAYALLRANKPADAFTAILAGIDQPYPDNRFAGGERTLADDAGMIGAALIASDASQRKLVETELGKRNIPLQTKPSTRFILYWETDANDVDFHIQDARGGHAFYASKVLPSGGELYADITTGYGPECFAIPGTPSAGPYRLSINYFSQGPMGYGMGLLEVQRFDGKGHLTFEDRPYVIMTNQAYVDLGSWK